MKSGKKYLMESDEEVLRLDLKTKKEVVEKHAIWSGIQPGMRVADLGCGSGKTTSILHHKVQPYGETVGVDFSEQRIRYAQGKYGRSGITFIEKDIRESMADLGQFDYVWVRFVLEYYRSESLEMVKHISRIVKPGGILCLIDLDYNCLTHYGMSERLEKVLYGLMGVIEEKDNFDPYAGRKLYTYLYDLEYSQIEVDVSTQHLIYGDLNEIDAYNWTKKIGIAARKSGFPFGRYYQNGYEGFQEAFQSFFYDPRRFTYTPMISCRGVKPRR